MVLDSRSKTILQAAIEAYIKTGEPVSSAWLFDHYDFGIKSAMIRHELNYLEEEGYLAQPHHSAGRVPTNKAYELYVRDLLKAKDHPVPASAAATARQRSGGALLRDYFKAGAWDDVVEQISDDLGVLGVAWDSRDRTLYAEGLHNIVAGVDPGQIDEIVKIVRDFEQLKNNGADLSRSAAPNQICAFVGKDNPVIDSEEVAAIAAGYRMGNGSVVYVWAIGPKRMNYSRAINLLQGLNF